MSIVARCGHCGFTWETSGLIGLGPGAAVNLGDVSTPCPKCGGTAKLLDGTWTGTNEGVVLSAGSAESQAIYATFKRLVEEARKGKLTPVQVQKQAAQLNEGLGYAVGLLIQRYPKTAVFIIALVAMLKVMNLETTVNVNDLVQQVIEYVDTEQPATTDATGGQLKTAKQKKNSGNNSTTGDPSTQKHDRLRHEPRPSQTRRIKNSARRSALRRKRSEFNPK